MYTQKPHGFNETTKLVACFIGKGNQLLFLKREDRLMFEWGTRESNDKTIVAAADRAVYSSTKMYVVNTDIYKFCGEYFLESTSCFSCHVFSLDVTNLNLPNEFEYDFLSPGDVDIGKLNGYEQLIFEYLYLIK